MFKWDLKVGTKKWKKEKKTHSRQRTEITWTYSKNWKKPSKARRREKKRFVQNYIREVGKGQIMKDYNYSKKYELTFKVEKALKGLEQGHDMTWHDTHTFEDHTCYHIENEI